MIHLGNMASLATFSTFSHSWGEGMNGNMIKMAMCLQPSVKAMVEGLPSSPSYNDCYIDLITNTLCMYVKSTGGNPDDWYSVAPTPGALVYVENLDQYWMYQGINGWSMVIDMGNPIPPIERALSVYIPGYIRPSTTIYHYIPTMEFTLPSGAPGSKATLEEAPIGGSLILDFDAGSRITFGAGQTEGTFTVPGDIILFPSETEGPYANPSELIVSSRETFDAQGLSITFKGRIRSL